MPRHRAKPKVAVEKKKSGSSHRLSIIPPTHEKAYPNFYSELKAVVSDTFFDSK